MPTFSPRSKERLATCEEELQIVLNDAIKDYDFSVVCGHRDMEEQNKAFKDGFSQKRWPSSKHNISPSVAVDIIPYPTGYGDIAEFNRMATYIFASASKHGVLLRWGGHWKTFMDYPHFELIL